MDVHHPVFWVSSVAIVLFVLGTLFFPQEAKSIFDASKGFSIKGFDWLFLLCANMLVVLCFGLIFTPLGDIRLGGAAAKSEFSHLSWFAMLFAAGMGIGLMFWSVAEPVGYFTDWFGTPLGVAPNTAEARSLAMGATLFHWGLHPWAIYAIVGLSLAFFSFNKNLPLSIRSGLYPIFGDRSWGWVGHSIDIVAVLATIFGLATSLGFGAQQAGGGMEYVFGITNTIWLQVTIVIGVTSVAIVSVIRGLDDGVKVLSNINMILALILCFFVFFLGPTLEIFSTLVKTVTSYATHIFQLSYTGDRTDEEFIQNWTVFYWAWWISWSPFVGMFIARISKGRTVREFLVAVLLIPTLVTAIWMSVFGGTALDQVVSGQGALAGGIGKVELAMFQMLESLPWANLTAILATIVVLIFFITSSDSGSLVIDSVTAGGKLNAPVPQRIFWATMAGLIAIALLVGGGADALGALQAAAITVGLPFSIILVALGFSLVVGLRHERKYRVKK